MDELLFMDGIPHYEWNSTLIKLKIMNKSMDNKRYHMDEIQFNMDDNDHHP
jgi:hypothetical protein